MRCLVCTGPREYTGPRFAPAGNAASQPALGYRPTMAKGYQFALRLEDDLLQKLDALIPRLSTPWHQATRSDVIRAAIEVGLPVLADMADRMPAPRPEVATGKTRTAKRR
jgi:predicted DNA-binding protein